MAPSTPRTARPQTRGSVARSVRGLNSAYKSVDSPRPQTAPASARSIRTGLALESVVTADDKAFMTESLNRGTRGDVRDAEEHLASLLLMLRKVEEQGHTIPQSLRSANRRELLGLQEKIRLKRYEIWNGKLEIARQNLVKVHTMIEKHQDKKYRSAWESVKREAARLNRHVSQADYTFSQKAKDSLDEYLSIFHKVSLFLEAYENGEASLPRFAPGDVNHLNPLPAPPPPPVTPSERRALLYATKTEPPKWPVLPDSWVFRAELHGPATDLGFISDTFDKDEKQFRGWFVHLDHNRDGHVSIAKFLELVEQKVKDLKREAISNMVTNFGIKLGDKLTWDAFSNVMHRVRHRVRADRSARMARAFARRHPEMKRLFDSIPSGEDGAVGIDDFISVMAKPESAELLGIDIADASVLSSEQAGDFFMEWDKDGDRRLTWTEFSDGMRAMSERVKKDTQLKMSIKFKKKEKKFQRLFQKMDRDGDGTVSLHEFLKALKSHGGLSGLLQEELSVMGEVEMFKLLDANQDGRLTFDEFKVAMLAVDQRAANSRTVSVSDAWAKKKNEFQKLFRSMKKSVRGEVSLDVFIKTLKKQSNWLGLVPEELGVMQESDLFRRLDRDNNGWVSWTEFEIAMLEFEEEAGRVRQQAVAAAFREREAKFRTLFSLLDTNDSGTVKVVTFIRSLKRHSGDLGLTGDDFNGLSEMDMFKMFDKDSDGQITYAEFSEVMAEIKTRERTQRRESLTQQFTRNEEAFRLMFNTCDKQHSGQISLIDFVQGAKKRPEFLQQVGRDAVTSMTEVELFKRADTDGSGKVTWEEFSGLMRELERENRESRLHALGEAWLQKEEIFRIAFNHIDTDHSGFISPMEFVRNLRKEPKLLKLIGHDTASSLPEMDIFRTIDADSSGDISWEEFKGAMNELVQRAQEQRSFKIAEAFDSEDEKFRRIFNRLDKNSDGRVYCRDFIRELRKCPEWEDFLGYDLPSTMNELTLFKRMDVDDSGSITWDEFQAVMSELVSTSKSKQTENLSDVVRENDEDFRIAFNRLDRNHTGKVNTTDFIAAIRNDPKLSEGLVGIPLSKLAVFRHCDSQGQISFSTWMNEMVSIGQAVDKDRILRLKNSMKNHRLAYEMLFERALIREARRQNTLTRGDPLSASLVFPPSRPAMGNSLGASDDAGIPPLNLEPVLARSAPDGGQGFHALPGSPLNPMSPGQTSEPSLDASTSSRPEGLTIAQVKAALRNEAPLMNLRARDADILDHIPRFRDNPDTLYGLDEFLQVIEHLEVKQT